MRVRCERTRKRTERARTLHARCNGSADTEAGAQSRSRLGDDRRERHWERIACGRENANSAMDGDGRDGGNRGTRVVLSYEERELKKLRGCLVVRWLLN